MGHDPACFLFIGVDRHAIPDESTVFFEAANETLAKLLLDRIRLDYPNPFSHRRVSSFTSERVQSMRAAIAEIQPDDVAKVIAVLGLGHVRTELFDFLRMMLAGYASHLAAGVPQLRSLEAAEDADHELIFPEEAEAMEIVAIFMDLQIIQVILEAVVSNGLGTTDPKLNVYYTQAVKRVQQRLDDTPGLRKREFRFDPVLSDLYPSEVRQHSWSGEVQPQLEQFLSGLTEYASSRELPPHLTELKTFKSVCESRSWIEEVTAYAADVRSRQAPLGSVSSESSPTKQSAEAKDAPDRPPSPVPAVAGRAEDGRPLRHLLYDRKENRWYIDGRRMDKIKPKAHEVLKVLIEAGSNGMTKDAMESLASSPRYYLNELREDPDWASVIQMSGIGQNGYKIIAKIEVRDG